MPTSYQQLEQMYENVRAQRNELHRENERLEEQVRQLRARVFELEQAALGRFEETKS